MHLIKMILASLLYLIFSFILASFQTGGGGRLRSDLTALSLTLESIKNNLSEQNITSCDRQIESMEFIVARLADHHSNDMPTIAIFLFNTLFAYLLYESKNTKTTKTSLAICMFFLTFVFIALPRIS